MVKLHRDLSGMTIHQWESQRKSVHESLLIDWLFPSPRKLGNLPKLSSWHILCSYELILCKYSSTWRPLQLGSTEQSIPKITLQMDPDGLSILLDPPNTFPINGKSPKTNGIKTEKQIQAACLWVQTEGLGLGLTWKWCNNYCNSQPGDFGGRWGQGPHLGFCCWETSVSQVEYLAPGSKPEIHWNSLAGDVSKSL